MLLVDPKLALKCSRYVKTRQIKYSYDKGMLLCFRVFRGALLNSKADTLTSSVHYRVFSFQEGFSRLHLGPYVGSGLLPNIPRSIKNTACHPRTDILAHGWKDIGKNMWYPLLTKCTSCNLTEAPSGVLQYSGCPSVKGQNELCHWLSMEEEYQIAREMCFWKSPLCAHGQKEYINSSMSVEDCYLSERCRVERLNSQRWILCKDLDICNPILTIKIIEKVLHNDTFRSKIVQKYRNSS